MARNPFQRGFLGDVGTGFAGGFSTGMGQGIDIFKALSTLELAKQQAAATQAQNAFTNRLGYSRESRDEAQYQTGLQKANTDDPLSGLGPNPYGNTPTNQSMFPMNPSLSPENYPTTNQAQQNQQPYQTVTQDPTQSIGTQYNPLAKHYKSLPGTKDPRVADFAALQRKRLYDLHLPTQHSKYVESVIDNEQSFYNPKSVENINNAFTKAQADSEFKGDPEDVLKNAKARLDTIRDYAGNATRESLGFGKYGEFEIPGWLGGHKIPGRVGWAQAASDIPVGFGKRLGPTPSKEELDVGDNFDVLGVQGGIQLLGGKTPKAGVIVTAAKDVPTPNQGYDTFKTEFKPFATKALTDYESTLRSVGDQVKIPKEYYNALKDYKNDPNIQKFIGDVSTPKKANAVVKSMVEQGVPHKQAMSIVAPIAQEQVKAKKQGVPMQQILFGDLGKQSKETKLPTIQKPAARKTMSITMPNATGGAEIVLPRRDGTPTITPNNASEMINSKVDEAPDFYINEKGEKKRGYAPYPDEALPPKSSNIHPDADFINKVAKHPKTIQNIRKLAATIRSTNGQIVNDKVLNSLDRNGLMMMDLALALIEKEDFSHVA